MTKLSNWIKVAITLALVSLVFYAINWKHFFFLLGNIPILDLVFCLVLLSMAYLVNGLRLILLQSRLELRVPSPLFWGSYYTGLLLNNILPAGVGGDAFRVLFLTRRGYLFAPLMVAGLSDRFFGMMALFAIMGVALIWIPQGLPISSVVSATLGWLMLLGSVVGCLLLPRLGVFILDYLGTRAINGWLTKIAAGSGHISCIFDKPIRILNPMALSILGQMLVVYCYVVLGSTLLPEISLAQYSLAIPGVMLALVLPITIGGLGLREISTVGLLVIFGADTQTVLTLSLVFLAINWISVIPGFFTGIHLGLVTLNGSKYDE